MVLTLFSVLFILITLVIFGSAVIFTVAMLLNAVKNRLISPRSKLLWLIAIISLPLVGALAYFFTVYHEPRRRYRVGERPAERVE